MKRAMIWTALLLMAVMLAGPAMAQAPETRQISVPLSNPGQPVRLSVSLLSGGIEVQGYDGPEVTVELVAEPVEQKQERVNGMLRIPNTSIGLTIEEEGNEVTIHGDWTSRIEVVRIRMPRRASLSLSCTNGGDVIVDGIQGQLELSNTNGSIVATNVSGSVVAQTTNGEVRVVFDSIQRDKAMSFVTLNGDVDVTFPADLKADLRLGSGSGDIWSDFDVAIQPGSTKVENEGDGGRFRVTIEQEVRSTVAGGGPEMHFKTWHGDIFVRAAGK